MNWVISRRYLRPKHRTGGKGQYIALSVNRFSCFVLHCSMRCYKRECQAQMFRPIRSLRKRTCINMFAMC
uniref:Transposase n=1 Tax=Ascaris lumbricoides TaxID=6252 RepID=A0A0M3HVM2_ASCLU